MPDQEPTKPAIGTDARGLNLYQKLAKILGEVGPVAKEGRNQEQGYAFIEQGQILAEIKNKLSRYGVVIVPELQDVKEERYKNARGNTVTRVVVDIVFDMINADNPDDHRPVKWRGESIDSSDKATQKAVTSATKYFLAKQFMISDKEDADANSEQLPPSAVEAAMHDINAVQATAVTKAKIRDIFKARGADNDDMAELLQRDYGVSEPALMTEGEAQRVLAELRRIA